MGMKPLVKTGFICRKGRRWKEGSSQTRRFQGKDLFAGDSFFLTSILRKDSSMLQDMSWRLYVLFMRFFKYRPPGIARRALSRMLRVAAGFGEEG